MANSQAIITAAKVAALTAIVPNGDTIKGALYLASASIGAGTSAYTATGEASGTGYSAGGATITHATAATSTGTTAFWTPSASLSWSGLTLASAVDCLLIYNVTQTNLGIGSFTFGSLTITAGTLTISFPVNDASNALVRIA